MDYKVEVVKDTRLDMTFVYVFGFEGDDVYCLQYRSGEGAIEFEPHELGKIGSPFLVFSEGANDVTLMQAIGTALCTKEPTVGQVQIRTLEGQVDALKGQVEILKKLLFESDWIEIQRGTPAVIEKG